MIFEASQLKSLGLKEMYYKVDFKVFTDLLTPPAFLLFFFVFKDNKLRNYDEFETDINVAIDLQEMINDGEFETIDSIFHNKQMDEQVPTVFDKIEDENYVMFVMYSYFLSTMLFVKFKSQL